MILRLAFLQDKKAKDGRLIRFSDISDIKLVMLIILFKDIEATLHCIMSVQEALDVDKASHLTRLFSPTILGRLPSTGHGRIRRTTLGVIGGSASHLVHNHY